MSKKTYSSSFGCYLLDIHFSHLLVTWKVIVLAQVPNTLAQIISLIEQILKDNNVRNIQFIIKLL